MANQKNVFINQVTITASALAQAFDMADTLTDVYFDRQYNTGGANALTPLDLEASGFTSDQIASFVTMAQQIQALRHNQAVVSGDYDATLNQLRRDI